jgi:hypothetical protein
VQSVDILPNCEMVHGCRSFSEVIVSISPPIRFVNAKAAHAALLQKIDILADFILFRISFHRPVQDLRG